MVVTREKTMVVMVRTLGSFFCGKKRPVRNFGKKRSVGILREIFLPQLPGFTSLAPTGFNRCLGEVSSHHGRGHKQQQQQGEKNEKAFAV